MEPGLIPWHVGVPQLIHVGCCQKVGFHHPPIRSGSYVTSNPVFEGVTVLQGGQFVV